MRFIFLLIFVNLFATEEFTIRTVKETELQAILELDRKVSFEFFKPLFMAGYSHLSIGQNPDYFLEKDLEADTKNFAKFLTENSAYNYLRVAFDNYKNRIVGLINFHIIDEKQTIEIDLLVIDKNYRGKGVGKKLVIETLFAFENLKYCIVHPFCLSNEKSLKFYYALGFKNLESADNAINSHYLVENYKLYYYLRLDISELKNSIKRSCLCEDGLLR